MVSNEIGLKSALTTYLLINNKDSFVYNLAACFNELGHNILVADIDQISAADLKVNVVQGIIISPGPGRPDQARVSLQVIKQYKDTIPILGVCLGHQTIAHAFGGVVHKGVKPMHGKVTPISHSGERLFQSLPESFQVTRYHSLIVKEATVAEQFYIDAHAEDGAVMAISHKQLPIYGVQFHPEAILTEYGLDMIENFHKLCEEWWELHV